MDFGKVIFLYGRASLITRPRQLGYSRSRFTSVNLTLATTRYQCYPSTAWFVVTASLMSPETRVCATLATVELGSPIPARDSLLLTLAGGSARVSPTRSISTSTSTISPPTPSGKSNSSFVSFHLFSPWARWNAGMNQNQPMKIYRNPMYK